MIEQVESIAAIVRRATSNYVNSPNKLGKFVSFSMYDTVERITAYLNSKHISGDTDALGREKPFFNIVVAAANIWFKATDLDRKDMKVAASKREDIFLTFFADALLQDWMRRARFGAFLNDWGLIKAQYGSVVAKFVKKDGELIASVIPWNRLIVDQKDFFALPVIEKIYRTPAQLRATKEYDQDQVEALLTELSTRKNLDGTSQDLVSEFIEIHEVHGELSIAQYKNAKGIEVEEDDYKNYRQQVHIISSVGNKKGGYDDFTLYCGYEEKNPYLIAHTLPQDGRTLAIGAVEYLFDDQWMTNHYKKNIKDTLDISGKLLMQTADQNFVGRNVLDAIETGDILVHAENKPLTQVNNSKADITALMNEVEYIRQHSQELTATPDALRGATPPSGTPYSTTALLTGQANSLFDKIKQNGEFGVEDMLRIHIVPYLKTKMNTDKEIMALMSDHDIKKIDAMYVPNEAIRRHNKNAKEQMLSGGEALPYDKVIGEMEVQQELSQLGNLRPLAPGDVNWNEALKDLEWNFEFIGSNEATDAKLVASGLTQALQLVLNPMYEQSPTAKFIVGKILSMVAGISPVELNSLPTPQPAPLETGGGGTKVGTLPVENAVL